MGSKRGYSWPPAEVGNELAIKHGANSERRWRPVADRLVAEFGASAPWLDRPAFAPTVAAWARAEAQTHLVAEWLDEHGLLDDDGVPRPATDLLLRLEASAARRRAELALTPERFARLLVVVADRPSMAAEREALLAEARALVEARPA